MSCTEIDSCAQSIRELCVNNAEFFKKDDSENGERLRLGFLGIVDHVNTVLPLVFEIEKVMPTFDFDKDTPGNGYRSFVVVVDACFKHALQLCSYINVNKESFIFRKGLYMKEVEAVSHMIASLTSCFQHLNTILSWSKPGELFPSSENNPEALLEQSDTVNQYAFYGRCLGIQFCSSIQPLLKFISTFMASFSEVYYNMTFSAKAQSFLSGGKFLLDPELRARRIVNISQHASIDFCKSFWFLAESELMKKIPDFVCSFVAVNTEIEIPPEPLKILSTLGKLIDIPIPSAHIGTKSFQIRLLSSNRREGMIATGSDSNKKNPTVPVSNSLIFHCHGGGFVAQSSKSHEVYLRDWASALEVPIISVDYSLAPEAPFPRALEEVFFAYCWAIKNCHILGTTAEKIVFAGDSAGANLLLGVTLKCIEFKIRKPDGLFLAYVPVIVSSIPSPSRLLCLMDPLLPIGFLLRCLKAYACPESKAVERKAAESQAAESQAAESQAVESQAVESQAVENQAVESKAVECKAAENTTVENTAVEIPSVESKTVKNGKVQCPKKSASDNSSQQLACITVEASHKEILSNPYKYKNHIVADCSSNMSSPFENSTEALFENKGESSGKDGIDKSKSSYSGLRKKFSNIISSTFKMVAKKDIDKTLTGNDMENLVNPFKEFKFIVPKDPYLCPYWAEDNVLSQLPPTCICSVQFDPCLDDCVMFAKKLKRLGVEIKLDILEGLPHGFLNFSKVNKNAEDGAKLCAQRIKGLLNLQNTSSKNSTQNNENGNLGLV